MRKIKVLLGTAALVSLLGFSSFAAITTTPKGVQKLDSADIVDVLNNNADILDDHVDKIAGTDILGHVKIGTGLEVTEDGTASVKIANDLETDDATTALSAAMGGELKDALSDIYRSDTIATGATKTYELGTSKSAFVSVSRKAANFNNTYIIDSWGGIMAISETNAVGTTLSVSNNVLSVTNNLNVAIQIIIMGD